MKEAGKSKSFKSFQKEIVIYLILLALAFIFLWKHQNILMLFVVAMAVIIGARYSRALKSSKATYSIGEKVEKEIKRQQEVTKKVALPIIFGIVGAFILFMAGLIVYVLYLKPYLAPKPEVTFPPVAKQQEVPEEITTDETADWQTYRNEQHGYEIKYPKDWYMEEDTVLITVIRPWQRKEGEYSDPQRELEIRVLPGEGLLEEGSYQLRWYGKEISLGRAEDKENTIIGNNYVGRTICLLADPNYGYPKGMCAYRVILLEHNKNLYEFTFFEEWIQTDVVDKILSTFRFLE